MNKKLIEQPHFEVMDMKHYRPKYRKDSGIAWAKIVPMKSGRQRKPKTYPLIDIAKVKIKKDFAIRDEILEQSRNQLQESGIAIPILLSPDNILLNGYEQYIIAKENKQRKIAFYPQKLSKGEKFQRKKAKAQKRRSFTKAEREAVFKKCSGKCSKCGKKVQIDNYKNVSTYMTIDHIKRISSGGTYDISNLRGLCYSCHQLKDNQGKHNKKKKGKNKRQ